MFKKLSLYLKASILGLALFAAGCTPAYAGSMSDYLENLVADYIFRAQTFTQPTTLCVGLATAAPTDASTGATVTEATYTGYARAAYNASFSGWKGTNDEVTDVPSAGTDATVSNASIVTIGSAATSGPETMTHFFVVDSCSLGAGNILFWAALTTEKTVNNGDPAPTFAIDALTVQIDN
jgi:hypothetical protein